MAKFILSAFADEANINIDGQIEALKRNDIQYIEVRGIGGRNIIKLNDEEVEEVKAKLSKAGIKVWSIGSPLGKISITDDFDKHFEDLKRAIEIAKKLDCKNIRMFSFFIPKGEDANKYREEVMRRLTIMLDYAEGTGVDLCHENEKDIYGDNQERTLDLMETLGSRFKGIFDPANFIQCGVETLSAFKQLKQYTKYMHIKDARMKDGKVVPAGHGDGHIKEILTILNKEDRDIVLTLEPHLSVFSGYSNLGDHTELGTKEFLYKTTGEAFDAASDSLKIILRGVNSMDKVRYGVIGIGNMGNGYLSDYKNEKIVGGVLTAICDNNQDKLNAAKEKVQEDCAFFLDAEEMMKSGLVDAVVIATPHYFHPTLAVKAFENDLHVVIEKPAGVFTKQVREMNEAAKKYGKKFMIMFQNRTNPNYIKLQEMVAEGAIGEIKRTTVIITDWYRPQAYYDSGSWRATWEGEGGGVLLNQAPHNLDLWQWVVGMMPSKITAFCHEAKWHNIEVEDDVTAYVEYPNGATGSFTTSTGDYPGSNYFEIAGDLGKLVLAGNKITYQRNKMSEKEFSATNKVGFAGPGCENVEVEVAPSKIGGGHIGMLNNFFDSILNGAPLFVPGTEGIKSLMISNAMYLSTWLNKTIELPIDEEEFLTELNKKRANSKFKEAKSDVVTDMSSSFMK